MSNILIGSSNVYRFYQADIFPAHKQYTMVKCVNMATYKARMCCIDTKEKFIIISTIENFIADAIKGKGNLTDEFGVVNKEGFNETLKDTLNTFFRSINEAAEKFPDTKFSVITPIQRPIHQWYTDNLDYMCKLFNDGMKMIKHGNVAKINCISKRLSNLMNREFT